MAVSDKVYGNLAGIGRFRAKLTTVLLLVSCVLVLAAGMYFFFKRDPTVPVAAVVRVADCKQGTGTDSKGNSVTVYDCLFTVAYTLDGKQYQTDVRQRVGMPLRVGDVMHVRADPAQPTKVLERPSYHTMSYVLSGVAALSAACALFQWWVSKSATASAAYGARTLWNVFD